MKVAPLGRCYGQFGELRLGDVVIYFCVLGLKHGRGSVNSDFGGDARQLERDVDTRFLVDAYSYVFLCVLREAGGLVNDDGVRPRLQIRNRVFAAAVCRCRASGAGTLIERGYRRIRHGCAGRVCDDAGKSSVENLCVGICWPGEGQAYDEGTDTPHPYFVHPAANCSDDLRLQHKLLPISQVPSMRRFCFLSSREKISSEYVSLARTVFSMRRELYTVTNKAVKERILIVAPDNVISHQLLEKLRKFT